MNDSKEINNNFIEGLEVDMDLVKRIQEIQELPKEIIVKFLKARGSLSLSDFGNSSVNEN
ncbi:MAG: hypothetical protein IPJ23_18875 [Ignavibacteriales bacterium]|nr:hypothetical protein [Ignavibacteriales bacterium]